jgi:hypothetical protein
LLRGEEIIAEVERARRVLGLEPHAVLPRDIGEAAGDVRAASKDDALDLGPDRRQRGADIVAAIEQRRELGLGDCLARRRNDRRKPPGAGIATGTWRARQHDRPAGSRRNGQGRHRLA